MMTIKTPVDRWRALRMAGALAGLAVALGACTHTDDVATTASIGRMYFVILSLLRFKLISKTDVRGAASAFLCL